MLPLGTVIIPSTSIITGFLCTSSTCYQILGEMVNRRKPFKLFLQIAKSMSTKEGKTYAS
jgi:hypothetical protein